MVIRYIDRKTGEEKIETPPGEGFLKFLYESSFGQLALDLLVKRKWISSVYGRLMNRPSSRSKIAAFVEELQIDMSESLKSIDQFQSFNDFFYRHLKPGTRPIQEGLVSPGDGKLLAFENVDAVGTFFAKGSAFTLQSYLQDEKLAQRFANAALFILRLAPNDYHRFHFPYSGTVSASQLIKGSYFSVSPYALAVNFTKVFCENKRTYTLLTTQDQTEILISPIGATMVGSIIDTYTPHSEVQKGDEMGYFAFGGSTVLMLVDNDRIKIDEDLLTNTQSGIETAVKMGEQIAHYLGQNG